MGKPIPAICELAAEAGLDYCLLYESGPREDAARVSHAAILLRPGHARAFRAMVADWAGREGWVLDLGGRRMRGSHTLRLVNAAAPDGVERACIVVMAAFRSAARGWINARRVLGARASADGIWRLPPDWHAAMATHLASLDKRYALADPAAAAEAGKPLAELTGPRALAMVSALLAAPATIYFAIARRLRPSGLSVVLLGPDGVGKSAALDAIEARLEKLFPNIERRKWRPEMLPSLNRLRTGRDPVTPLGERMVMAGIRRRTGILPSFIRLIYYGLDYTLGYWLRIRPHMNRGALVLCDRYFYDYFVDPGSRRVTAPRWVLRAFCAFYSRPQRGFILLADAEHIRVRRADLPVDEIERQNRAFHDLIRRYPELEPIEANLGRDAVVDRIVERIFHMERSEPD